MVEAVSYELDTASTIFDSTHESNFTFMEKMNMNFEHQRLVLWYYIKIFKVKFPQYCAPNMKMRKNLL